MSITSVDVLLSFDKDIVIKGCGAQDSRMSYLFCCLPKDSQATPLIFARYSR